MIQQLRLTTPRLELIALYPELARAAVSDRDLVAKLINAKVPDEFPPEIMVDVMEYFAQRLEEDPRLVGWWGWYIILNQQQRVLIGSLGFTGYPDTEGNLLMGYSLVDAYQRNGYTTEAVKGLLNWAWKQPQVMSVTAETFPDNTASIKVMEKSGMVFLGNGTEEGTIKYGIKKPTENNNPHSSS